MESLKQKLDSIIQDLESTKCNVWEILDNVRNDSLSELIKEHTNSLLDYLEMLLDELHE